MCLPSGDSLLVQIMDDAFAQASQHAGERLVCRQGCTQCCHGAFVVNPLDVLRLRSGMDALRATSLLSRRKSSIARRCGLLNMRRVSPAIR
jgi:hypothetical protein